MPRGGKYKSIKKLEPDPMYGSLTLAKFINRVMQDGKKTTAQRAVYDAFEVIKSQGKDPMETFEKALDTVGPRQEVRAKRIGGAAYQVPVEVRGERRIALACRWILDATRKRPNTETPTFAQKLAAELLAASNNEGEAIRKRDVTYKMAEANKAFAHFKW